MISSTILKTIRKFSKIKALVIGEAMLDVYLQGTPMGLAREAPVPKIAITEEENFAGGAGNAAVNAARLGASIKFLSVVGDDPEGKKLLPILRSQGVDSREIYVDPARRTLIKKRVFADGHLLLRFDEGTVSVLTPDAEKDLIAKLLNLYSQADLAIISDYGYGILTEKIRNAIARLQHIYSKTLIIDSKHLGLYQKIKSTAIKPNFAEAAVLLGITRPQLGPKRIEQLIENKEKIFSATEAEYAAVTCDKDGAVIFGKEGLVYRTFSQPVKNIKTAGAGDTFAAAFGLSLAAGASIWNASEIAGKSAGVIIQKEGTAYCSKEELIEAFGRDSKLVASRGKLALLVKRSKERGKKIVFTNGCFDILHSGHINYLSSAKKMGAILIVGVNTDASVRKLKGKARPVNTLSERLGVLSGLSSIDYLVPFAEKVPLKLIRIIKPDIFVKGGDYTESSLLEAKVVKVFGGKVEIVPFVSERSTTATIARIRELFKV